MKTNGSAVWQGGIKDGKGAISTKSGALKAYPYGFSSRFEGKPGTNPEELIGAAHAGCFTMALSLILGEAKLTAEHMETTAEVTLDKVSDGFAITAVHLTLRAKVPGADKAKFEELAAKARPVVRFPSCSTPTLPWTRRWSIDRRPENFPSVDIRKTRPDRPVAVRGEAARDLLMSHPREPDMPPLGSGSRYDPETELRNSNAAAGPQNRRLFCPVLTPAQPS